MAISFLQENIPEVPLSGAQDGIDGFDIRTFERYRVLRRGSFAACPTGSAHRHAHFELFWITAGSGLMLRDFEEVPVTMGKLVFVPPGEVHAWLRTRKMAGARLSFSRNFLAEVDALRTEPLSPWLWRQRGQCMLQIAPVEIESINRLVTDIKAESSSLDPDRGEFVKTLLSVLLHKARRLMGTVDPVRAEHPLTTRFQQVVQGECPPLVAVKEFAQRLSVSRSLLHRTVQRDTGRAPSEWIHEQLLVQAKRRLRHTDAPIAEISRTLGFSDPSYFGRFFRRHAGVSPKAFRSAAT